VEEEPPELHFHQERQTVRKDSALGPRRFQQIHHQKSRLLVRRKAEPFRQQEQNVQYMDDPAILT
jgi:hypothetical protein